MAKKKKIVKVIKLQIQAGKANPAPPVGPCLGAAGVNIMAFCKDFNARTQKEGNVILPVLIEVYADKSFTFKTFQPPMSRLIMKAAGLESGSKEPSKEKVGKLTLKQAQEVADKKRPFSYSKKVRLAWVIQTHATPDGDRRVLHPAQAELLL